MRSQWVSREVWHPSQKTSLDSDGSLLLSIPYSDDRELVGDIIQFGPEVEVLTPPLRSGQRYNTHCWPASAGMFERRL